jgi:two-component system, OmpR family, alkaline phosphatase synthesis response regulator PhoP
MNEYKILVVDDEKDIVDLLKYNLQKEGYKVITAYDGEEALEKILSKPDLILLDIMMPKYDGFEVCKKMKNNPHTASIPVIFLTAKNAEVDEVLGLELGADDYIEKPISIRKIIARIKNVLRKKYQTESHSENEVLIFKDLVLNKQNYTVRLKGKDIVLARKEFEILSLLMSHPGRVFSRNALLNSIWGEQVYVVDRTIDVHIRKIREKLMEYDECIETIKGVGYRFKEE